MPIKQAGSPKTRVLMPPSTWAPGPNQSITSQPVNITPSEISIHAANTLSRQGNVKTPVNMGQRGGGGGSSAALTLRRVAACMCRATKSGSGRRSNVSPTPYTSSSGEAEPIPVESFEGLLTKASLDSKKTPQKRPIET